VSAERDRISTRTCILTFIAFAVAIAIFVILARHYVPRSEIRAGFQTAFLTQPSGYQGLRQYYGFKLQPEPKKAKSKEAYKALSDGSVDIINGRVTDGRILEYNLVVLNDDKRFFPPQQAVPVVRRETLVEHPEIHEILEELEGRIPSRVMRKLNHKVMEEGYTSGNAAREFLASEGLIPMDAMPGNDSAGEIAVGSKKTVEQELLGQIMATMIEFWSDIRVMRRLNLGDTMVCFNALRSNRIDLYAEYTGTGLTEILKQEAIRDPDKAYRILKQTFGDKYDLIWLKAFGFSNNRALVMRQDHAEKLGIYTISDLAEYIKWQVGGVPPLSGQF
jgi:osmoprotectant transport system permease protein